jgi:hypothetical protein
MSYPAYGQAPPPTGLPPGHPPNTWVLSFFLPLHQAHPLQRIQFSPRIHESSISLAFFLLLLLLLLIIRPSFLVHAILSTTPTS